MKRAIAFCAVLLTACAALRSDIRMVVASDAPFCRALGAVTANGLSTTDAIAKAQNRVAELGGNSFFLLQIVQNPGLPGDLAIFSIGQQFTVLGQALHCPSPQLMEAFRDPAIQDLIAVRLPTALRAQGRDPEQFYKVQLQRLAGIAMPDDRQRLFLAFLAHRAKNGAEIFIAFVDAPLDQVQAIARLDDDSLVLVLERMDAAFSAQRPIPFDQAVKQSKI